MQKLLSTACGEDILSLAIGKFDGVHLAHQRLLQRLCFKGAVLVVDRQEPKRVLTPLSDRARLLKKYASQVYFLPLEIACPFSPLEFVQLIEDKFPLLQKIVVGYDFRFGRERVGNTETLRALLDKKIALEVVPEIKIKGIPLHSCHIKESIQQGNVVLAQKFLGRPFVLEGPVIPGQQLGRKRLYPTLNMSLDMDLLLPSFGVYATRVEFAHACFLGVSFLGHRLSTDGKMALETHVLDAPIFTTPRHLRLIFVQKIRDNAFFGDLNSLKHQISLDMQEAKGILKAQ